MTPYCPLTLLSVNFKVFTRKYATTDVNFACHVKLKKNKRINTLCIKIFLTDNFVVVKVNIAHLNDVTKYKYSDGYKTPRPQQIIRINGAYNHVDWKSQKVCKRHIVQKYAISIGTKNSDHLKSNKRLPNFYFFQGFDFREKSAFLYL